MYLKLILTQYLILAIIFVVLFVQLYIIYIRTIDYWGQIVNNSYKQDYTRWILTDKYVAKQYAKLNGFEVPETYQIVQYPNQFNFDKFPKNFVIKPLDLCDSAGVYLIKNNININNININNININTQTPFEKQKLIDDLFSLRCKANSEYYMTEHMYNGAIPYSGYIAEELLLDENGEIPYDHKCYVFNGKIYFIAVTYNRRIIDGVQHFDSLWHTRDWVPIKYPMIKKGYKYGKIPKPKNFDNLIKIIENLSAKLQRHCRIDVYFINGKVYLGELTFFGGAFLHTYMSNFILGISWLCNPDNYKHEDPLLKTIVPKYYNNHYNYFCKFDLI